MSKHEPKIIIPKNAKPWPHKLRIAKALCAAGYTVEFVPESDTAKTPDILLDGSLYEIKSPVSSNIDAIERNLKRAMKQSNRVIFDSSRMKGLRDEKIRAALKYQCIRTKALKSLIYISKSGKIEDLTKTRK